MPLRVIVLSTPDGWPHLLSQHAQQMQVVEDLVTALPDNVHTGTPRAWDSFYFILKLQLAFNIILY